MGWLVGWLVCIGWLVGIGTDRSEQTVQTQIRLLLQEQSDQGLHCLSFHLHFLDALLLCKTKLFDFKYNCDQHSF